MQGFNMGRYVPPDLEGTISFNAASGKGHALGARASKLKTDGILTVRFELPFPVWCTHCKPEQIIGQGVRFNAEKKKVGNYYSTPIWSFRFKHTVCGGWIEVRTDPKNTAYTVVEGGRRRDTGEDRLAEGEILIGATEEDKDRLEKDGAFGALEKKVTDTKAAASEKRRVDELQKRNERDWDDPYEQNKRLRSHFREGRNLRKAAAERTENLREKMSLGIELAEEKDEDEIRARLITFGEESQQNTNHQEMFSSPNPPNMSIKDGGKRDKKMSSEELLAAKKSRLTQEVRGNTRAAKDPFLADQQSWTPSTKRKKAEPKIPEKKVVSHSTALVDYDSD